MLCEEEFPKTLPIIYTIYFQGSIIDVSSFLLFKMSCFIEHVKFTLKRSSSSRTGRAVYKEMRDMGQITPCGPPDAFKLNRTYYIWHVEAQSPPNCGAWGSRSNSPDLRDGSAYSPKSSLFFVMEFSFRKSSSLFLNFTMRYVEKKFRLGNWLKIINLYQAF